MECLPFLFYLCGLPGRAIMVPAARTCRATHSMPASPRLLHACRLPGCVGVFGDAAATLR